MSEPANTTWRTVSLDGGQTLDHALLRSVRLEVTSGPDAGKRYVTTRERAVIGTHRAADWVLEDKAISRFHLELLLDRRGVAVRDLESRNGTRVDGVSVGVAYLNESALLSLGRTQVRLELGHQDVKLPLANRKSFGLLLGTSLVMRVAFARLERAAASDATVLLEGETGTGKDLAAESIHRASVRADKPFVVVDCGAVSPSLIESELFGHVRGAFTGAERARPGAFELAHGGTIFLDEIGELDLDLQPKLLRVLESREVQRVGGTRRIPVDVRVIAATNRKLHTEVNAGRFRSDLYYRLAVLEIELAPLRERKDDIPLLAQHLLVGMGVPEAVAAKLRDPRFLASLARHPWPGNVRELRNYMERCIALEQALPLGQQEPSESSRDLPPIEPGVPLKIARDRFTHWFERCYLEKLLEAHDGNVSAAARAAGIDRAHLYRLLFRRGLR
jgi:two-component system, NtrC family, response regulator GlrR